MRLTPPAARGIADRGLSRSPASTCRRLECERHPPSAVGDTPPKRLRDGSSRFRTDALAGSSSASKKADDYPEDGPAPCGRSAAASERVAANFMA